MKKVFSVIAVSGGIFTVLWILRLFEVVHDPILLAVIGGVLFFFGAVVLKILVPRIRPARFFSVKPMSFLEWQLTLSLTILLICGSFLLNYLTGIFYDSLAVGAPVAFSGDGYTSVGSALLCIAVIPALFEELYFRGAVLTMLRCAKMKNWITVVFCGALFMILHGPGWYFLTDFYAGVLLSLLVFFTGSVYASVAAHLLANTASYFLALYGGRLEAAGIENLTIHVTVVCFLGALCHLLHLLKKLILKRDAEDRSRVNENSRRWEEKKKKGEEHHGNKG